VNEGPHLRATVDDLTATLPAGAEILVIDDGSTDGSTDFLLGRNGRTRLLKTDSIGVAKARNMAARETSADVILFLDAHMRLPPGWCEPLLETLARPGVGAAAPIVSDTGDRNLKGFGLRYKGPDLEVEWLGHNGAAPHPVPILPWCCAAIRRETFETVGGFDEQMIRWGGIDNEISVRMWLLGYELWVTPQAEVFHLFREERPYQVEWSWLIHNRLRTAFLHFSTERIARSIEALRDHEGFPAAVALTMERDIAARRTEFSRRRAHDDQWYLEKFGPQW
jgi:GT2 family glycosyltransferase